MQNDIVNVNVLPELKAQMETAVDIAKRYPRDLVSVKREIEIIATVDHKTAQDCFYALPRGNKIIPGESIRMAEIVAYSWQHIRVESRIVSIDAKTLTCEAICWDMERNVMARKSVQRKILGKNGNRFNDDMINTTAGAGMAIAERNAIFKVIPKAVLKEVFGMIKRKAMDDPDPLAVKVKRALEFCATMKINRDAVLAFVGKKTSDEINEDDLFTLKSSLNAIKDGDATISEVFYPDKEPKKKESPKAGRSSLAKGKGKMKTEHENKNVEPKENKEVPTGGVVKDSKPLVGSEGNIEKEEKKIPNPLMDQKSEESEPAEEAAKEIEDSDQSAVDGMFED
ncbi:MAG: hypothetical protein DRH26_01835 [Deltaproteobacteria bacterium]|nr:MAG: hypothetical protein DRH26_01835 [Deltaproteobacteria bacterium]